jgi:hypothetical protein
MEFLSPDMLKKYFEKKFYPSVSIYMPTFTKGEEVEQNHIRYKNNLRDVEKKLAEAGLKKPDIDQLIMPAERLLDDTDFWNHQEGGLAVFFSPQEFFYYTSPDSFTEKNIIADRFNLRPFLTMLNSNERYLVLALNQKNIRLFEGTRYSLNELPLKNVMTSIEDYFSTEEEESNVQMHGQRGGTAAGGRTSMYQLQGNGHDDAEKKEDIKQFFHIVDKGIQKILNTEKAPMILAGIEYLLPLYRETNSYANTLEDVIPINTAEFSNDELRIAAWHIVKQRVEKNLEDALVMYGNYHGTARATDNAAEIVKNLYSNRIYYLFIDPEVNIWGKFDQNTYRVEVHNKEYEKGDIDLLDLAAEQTVLHNGIVFSVNANQLPGGKFMAALFRY